MEWIRPQHRLIAEALGAMDAGWLLESGCFFGGGTAIVLRNGEYRRSLDVDFLCSDRDGYRALRERAMSKGLPAFFGQGAETIREFRADRYGIRGVLGWKGQHVKVEIVQEARIELSGEIDNLLGVPVLSDEDQVAEKLLANADRWADPGTACRDALDLGFLTIGLGGRIPEAARDKAELAYGQAIGDSVGRVLGRLSDPVVRERAAMALEMDVADATRAAVALRDAAAAAWPDLQFVEIQTPRNPWDR